MKKVLKEAREPPKEICEESKPGSGHSEWKGAEGGRMPSWARDRARTSPAGVRGGDHSGLMAFTLYEMRSYQGGWAEEGYAPVNIVMGSEVTWLLGQEWLVEGPGKGAREPSQALTPSWETVVLGQAARARELRSTWSLERFWKKGRPDLLVDVMWCVGERGDKADSRLWAAGKWPFTGKETSGGPEYFSFWGILSGRVGRGGNMRI